MAYLVQSSRTLPKTHEEIFSSHMEACNRLLITERWAHLHMERGGEVVNHKGINWRCDDGVTELDPEFCHQQPSGDYGQIRVVGARYLNRRLDPHDLSCFFNGTVCHMYGQHNAFRNIILRSLLLECTNANRNFGFA